MKLTKIVIIRYNQFYYMSLLANDFEEDYIRIENKLITNQESFYINREGRLSLTTPFFTSANIIDETVIPTFGNKIPSAVEIHFDQVSFFSTNPNCVNYLPLKIEFGIKPKLEFGDVDFSALTDYKIITSDEINLDIIENRLYDKFYNYSFFINDDEFKFVINVTQCLNFVFILYDIDGLRYIVKYKFDSTDFSISQESGIINFVGVTSVVITYSNESFSIAVVLVGNDFKLYNLLTTPPSEIDITFGVVEIVSIILTKEAIIIWQKGGILTIIAYDETYVNFNELLKLNNVFTFAPNNNSITAFGNYNTKFHCAVSMTSTNHQFEFFKIDNNKQIIQRQKAIVENILGVVRYIFIGGSNLNKPTITFFTFDNDIVRRYFFPEYDDYFIDGLPMKSDAKIFKILGDNNETIIKEYRNQAYFVDYASNIIMCNLDNGNIVKWNQDFIKSKGPPPKFRNSVNFSKDCFIDCGSNLLENNSSTLVSNIFVNSRPVNQVYKMVYNYGDRIYPYKNNNLESFTFSLSLPDDTPIADIEIFKYIIDFRIRYSKTPLIINPATAAVKESDSKISKRKKRRDVGDVEKILGLVGDDFTVNDFLKLYS